MKKFGLCFIGLLSLAISAPLAWAGDDPLNPEEFPTIERLKPLYPETVLVRDGQARALIVAPDREGYEGAVGRLSEGLRAATGLLMEVRKGSEIVDDSYRIKFELLGGRTPIALGNVNNNRLLAWLWTEGYVFEDSIYPGKGGYVVRTVHDPFARGINVLELAGSDPEGVDEAVKLFLERYLKLHGRDLKLDEPIICVAFERRAYPFFPEPGTEITLKRMPQFRTPEGINIMLKNAGFMDEEGRILTHPNKQLTVTSFLGSLSLPASTYCRTGDKRLLPVMKEMLDKNRHLLANPDRLHDMGHRASGMTQLWDLMEEWPIWTDRDRLEITNALLRDAMLGHERRPMHKQVLEGCLQCMDENHGTSSALCSYEAWKYFQKYYRIPEGEYWMKVADACFAGQASTFQPLEDAAGYLVYNPLYAVSYALQSKDLRYLERGIAYEHAKFVALACMNNLGFGTGFGDAPALIEPQIFELLATTAWYHRDPYLYWILRERLPRAAGLRIFQKNIVVDMEVEPKEPVEWTGLILFPIYEMPLFKGQGLKEPVFAPKRPWDPKRFNKIVFKENWSPDGQYLLLDGAGVWGDSPGPHGHKHNDINTIINFTSHGRMWLVDHTYPMRECEKHSGVLVSRDGQTLHSERELSELLNILDDPELAITRTRVGLWDRTICWRKGRYFILLDRVVADKEGEYLARCTFKALGEHSLKGRSLHLAQAGRWCKILSDGAADMDVKPAADLSQEEWQRFYPHAEPTAKYYRQDKSRRMNPEETLGFINLLYAYSSPDEADTVAMKPISEHAALVTDRGTPLLVGLGAMPGGGAADVYAITESFIYALGAVELCDGLVRTDKPCDLGIALNRKTLLLQCREETRVEIQTPPSAVREGDRSLSFTVQENRATFALTPGKHLLLIYDWKGQDTAATWARKALASASESAARFASRQLTEHARPEFSGLTVEKVELDMPIHVLERLTLGDDAREVWVAGGEKGVRAYARDGKPLWSFETARPVRALAIGDTDGDGAPEIAAGCDDEHVYLLNRTGQQIWSFKCKPSLDSNGLPPKVDQVWIADLERDGKAEVIAGANWVHVIGHDGKLKWERYMMIRRGRIVGDFVCGAVADLDGDNKLEILAAYNTSYPLILGYDAAGEIIFPRRRADESKGDAEGMNVGLPCRVEAADLFGGREEKEIIVGSPGLLLCFWRDQRRREEPGYYSRLHVVDFRLFRPDRSKPLVIIAANSTGRVEAHGVWSSRGRSIQGKLIWSRSFAEEVSALLPVERPNPPPGLLFVGTRGGSIHVLNIEDGNISASARQAGSAVERFVPERGSESILALLADGTLLRVKLTQ